MASPQSDRRASPPPSAAARARVTAPCSLRSQIQKVPFLFVCLAIIWVIVAVANHRLPPRLAPLVTGEMNDAKSASSSAMSSRRRRARWSLSSCRAPSGVTTPSTSSSVRGRALERCNDDTVGRVVARRARFASRYLLMTTMAWELCFIPDQSADIWVHHRAVIGYVSRRPSARSGTTTGPSPSAPHHRRRGMDHLRNGNGVRQGRRCPILSPCRP